MQHIRSFETFPHNTPRQQTKQHNTLFSKANMRFTLQTLLFLLGAGTTLALPTPLPSDSATETETYSPEPQPPKYHSNMAAWKRKEFIAPVNLVDGAEPLKRDDEAVDPATMVFSEDGEAKAGNPKTLILWKRDADVCKGAQCFKAWKRGADDEAVDPKKVVFSEDGEAKAGDPKTLILWNRDAEAEADVCKGAQCYKAW